MSAAGQLTAAELTAFISGGYTFTLENVTEARWRGFADQVEREFGIRPTITWSQGLPSGGYRTVAMQRIINPGLKIGNHMYGKAVDNYNQRTFRNINEKRYLEIASYWGFVYDATGEPWHMHCINNSMPANVTPANSGNSTPITSTPASKGHSDMYIAKDVAGPIYLVTDGGWVHLQQVSHLNLFERMINKAPTPDSFNAVEINIMISYVSAAQNDENRMNKMLAAIAGIPKVDAAGLATAITNQLKAAGIAADYDKMAAIIQTKLASNFAEVAVGAAQQTETLSAELAKVGTIDKSSVVEAIAEAFGEVGVNSIADAVYSVIKPELVKLELVNQIK